VQAGVLHGQDDGVLVAFVVMEVPPAGRRHEGSSGHPVGTHGVDDVAIFLSDSVVMMTDGPEAEVGDILSIPFEGPRNRKEIMENPRCYELREHLITLLNDKSHIRPSREQAFKPSPDMQAELATQSMTLPGMAA
jgi:nitrate/nitrite transport system ATP-binding protein